jgi:hypothetical protein
MTEECKAFFLICLQKGTKTVSEANILFIFQRNIFLASSSAFTSSQHKSSLSQISSSYSSSNINFSKMMGGMTIRQASNEIYSQ